MIQLLNRAAHADTPVMQGIDAIARRYQRNARARGGFYTAGFEITGADATRSELLDYFNTWIGRTVRERAQGLVAWEGMISRLSLVMDGDEYQISLEPRWWHNRVDVYYSNAAVEDTNQGTLNYLAGPARLQDTGQDFSDWETTSGNAAYRIQVANSDGTVSWGYLGAASTVTNANDTVAVYQDLGLGTAGWNGDSPGKSSTYQVMNVSLENSRANVGASDDASSQAEYGRMDYVVSLAGADATAATALRDRHLAEYAWPRARFVGRSRAEDRLVASANGFWNTLFWRYRNISETGAASTVIANLVGDSEFVTAGVIESNTLEVTADGYPIPQRIGDLITRVVDQGDASGNVYRVGVYGDRALDYEQVDDDYEYMMRDGALFGLSGAPVVPELVRPGRLVRVSRSVGVQPPGGNVWSDPGVAYIDQVEWQRDRGALMLSLAGLSSAVVLQQQIQQGSA